MFKVGPASQRFEEARLKLVDELKTFGDDLTPIEQLAIVSYLVGQLIALQDQTKFTTNDIMRIVGANLEQGNADAIASTLGQTDGKS